MRTLGNTIVGAGIVGLVGLLAGCASMATRGPGSVASEKGPARLRQVSLFSNPKFHLLWHTSQRCNLLLNPALRHVCG